MSIDKIKIVERLLKEKHISVKEAVILINSPVCSYKLSSDFKKIKEYNPENIQAFQ
tara:strand:+ start:110 stop:277 length:168 start_codon:yes stop_codon:yes gene_type:complete